MEKIRLIKLIKDSIVAGILIGFGCITNVSCNNPVVGAFLFSLGLFAVIIQGRYLFTGKVGYCGHEEITGRNYELVLGLFTNLISVWLLCFLFAKFSGLSIECNELVSKKLHEGIVDALVRSIGCGAMMYIAVDGYSKTKNPITIIMPVMVFILCGFDHCIANFGYMGLCGYFFIPIQLICWVVGNSIGSWIISKI